jgi:hypothetical protein
MTLRDIRTAHPQVACDVCGRTLLRGEHSATYLAGGDRREVCDLCAVRAIHEGWVREGTSIERGTRSISGDRRRSFLDRLRTRPAETGATAADRPLPRSRIAATPVDDSPAGDEAMQSAAPANGSNGAGHTSREPRQVRAVPTSVEQRTASAIDLFNASEHPRTIAGVARSLGAPVVAARPAQQHGSLVTIVVSWELCWYRYEVDLSDEGAVVRAAGQGYELSELPAEDREPIATVDEYGALALA